MAIGNLDGHRLATDPDLRDPRLTMAPAHPDKTGAKFARSPLRPGTPAYFGDLPVPCRGESR